MHAHGYGCQDWLSEDDPMHEEPDLGCQVSEYLLKAKEYVDDAIIKNVFLSCWKKNRIRFC